MDRAVDTLQEIEEVLNIYKPLSSMSSKIFFTLQSMGNIHFLYQSSLAQFMDLLDSVLTS
jgi:hypothetical protein